MSGQNAQNSERVIRLEGKKPGKFHLIFGRTGIILLLLLVQMLVLFSVFKWLGKYVPLFWSGGAAASAILSIYLVNRSGDPTITITWIVLIMLLPVFGTLLYIFVRTEFGHRLLHRRLAEVLAETRDCVAASPSILEELPAQIQNLAHYVREQSGYPLCANTRVQYFPLGEEMFQAMLERMESAKHFIFLEFFIVAEGYMWGRMLDILQRKAQEGVEIRMLYDGTCAFTLLPYEYPEKLKALGIDCRMFAPIRPFVSTHYNNRDHRKILVVDGLCAFTGGVNLADEYINRTHPHGHWKDTGLLLEGDAVRNFTLMFLQMWAVTGKSEEISPYLAPTRPVEAEGYVLPYGDVPLDEERVGEMVYLEILHRAERYVHITSPYLILDNELVSALTFAAKRGVDVKIILPGEPDHYVAYALAYTHYRTLLRAGVRLYSYAPGFIHAKSFVSDDLTAVVGTINLDYRSLCHHFECAAYLYNSPAVAAVESDFQKTLEVCRPILLEDLRKEKFSRKCNGYLLKWLAPLM